MEIDKLSLKIIKCLNSCDSKTSGELIGIFGKESEGCIDFLVRDKYIKSNPEHKTVDNNSWKTEMVFRYKIDGYGKSYLFDRRHRNFDRCFTRVLSIIAIVISIVALVISWITQNKV